MVVVFSPLSVSPFVVAFSSAWLIAVNTHREVCTPRSIKLFEVGYAPPFPVLAQREEDLFGKLPGSIN